MSQWREMALRTTILRTTYGSELYGLNLPESADRDEFGVCVEDIDALVGFSEFGQDIYRTAAEREGKHDARSGSGDLDLKTYGLRKFISLALGSNPDVLPVLYAPPELTLICDSRGQALQALAPHIVSAKAGGKFLGYLRDQLERLVGLRGGKDVHRPELVEKYGYDTKYAMHSLRLGYQGIELLSTGRITLPMREPDRSYIRDVRVGKVTLSDVIELGRALEDQLDLLRSTTILPPEPNVGVVQKWMVQTYLDTWNTPSTPPTMEQIQLDLIGGSV